VGGCPRARATSRSHFARQILGVNSRTARATKLRPAWLHDMPIMIVSNHDSVPISGRHTANSNAISTRPRYSNSGPGFDMVFVLLSNFNRKGRMLRAAHSVVFFCFAAGATAATPQRAVTRHSWTQRRWPRTHRACARWSPATAGRRTSPNSSWTDREENQAAAGLNAAVRNISKVAIRLNRLQKGLQHTSQFSVY
jgi:hypothetical protein